MAMLSRNYAVRTSKNGLNLREKPSKASNILRLIPNGETVTIDPETDTPKGWFAVEGGGYVMAEFLVAVKETVEPVEPLPEELENSLPDEDNRPRRGRRRRYDD